MLPAVLLAVLGASLSPERPLLFARPDVTSLDAAGATISFGLDAGRSSGQRSETTTPTSGLKRDAQAAWAGEPLPANQATGSLLYVAVDNPALGTVGAYKLDLATMKETHVGTLGSHLGSWGTEAGAVRHTPKGTTYITNLAGQIAVDPWVPDTGCTPPCKPGDLCCRDPGVSGNHPICMTKLNKCSDIHDKNKEQGQTIGVDVNGGNLALRLNTSLFWQLAIDAKDLSGNTMIVLAETPGANQTHPSGNNFLKRVDLTTGAEVQVGAFTPGLVAVVNDAAYDAAGRVMYAMLNSFDTGRSIMFAMDVDTGSIKSQGNIPFTTIIQSFDYDPVTKKAYTIIKQADPATHKFGPWKFGSLDLATLEFTAIGDASYAAYFQLNTVVIAPEAGLLFTSFFKMDSQKRATLWLVATDVATGAISAQWQRTAEPPQFVNIVYDKAT